MAEKEKNKETPGEQIAADLSFEYPSLPAALPAALGTARDMFSPAAWGEAVEGMWAPNFGALLAPPQDIPVRMQGGDPYAGLAKTQGGQSAGEAIQALQEEDRINQANRERDAYLKGFM